VTFGLWNGSKFIQISSDQVFDGQSGSLDVSATPNPITAQGRVHTAIEEFVASGYAADNNFMILRTSWLYSFDETIACPCELNIAKKIKEQAEGQTEISVANNIMGRPILVENLVKGIPNLFFSDISGIQHIGSLNSCSLAEFAEGIVPGVTVNGYVATSAQNYIDDPILGEHTINNNTLELSFHKDEFKMNLLTWELNMDCFTAKSLTALPDYAPLLYPMWLFMEPDFLNSPNKQQFLADLETNGTILNYFDSIEEYNIDLQLLNYFFPVV